MSHPKNKRDRFLKGNNKALKRVSLWFLSDDPRNDKWKKVSITRHRNTTKKCNHVCCGNPRRYFGELTFQERRFLDSLKD